MFVWSLATYALREAINATAEQVEYGVDKFKKAGLKKQAVKLVEVEGEKIPKVEDSSVNFECAYYSTICLPGNPPMGSVDVVIREVVGIHIKEVVLTDGKIDLRKTQPIARCGYYEYAVVKETFEMIVPGGQKAMLAGLEGSTKVSQENGGCEDSGREGRCENG